MGQWTAKYRTSYELDQQLTVQSTPGLEAKECQLERI